MIEQLIAEATECDFKVALETKKPKSWLKSVSAFSNGIGGTVNFPQYLYIYTNKHPVVLSQWVFFYDSFNACTILFTLSI